MSTKYPKVLQVHLNETQHEMLRAMAYKSRTSMVEWIRRWIDSECDRVPVSGAAPPPAANIKPLPERVERPRLGQSPIKVDQKTCKHQYNQNMVCWKCGYNSKP